MQEILSFAALLACPVGMGVMMWMMGRGNRRKAAGNHENRQPASLERLREEHRRLSAELDHRDAQRANDSRRLEGLVGMRLGGDDLLPFSYPDPPMAAGSRIAR